MFGLFLVSILLYHILFSFLFETVFDIKWLYKYLSDVPLVIEVVKIVKELVSKWTRKEVKFR